MNGTKTFLCALIACCSMVSTVQASQVVVEYSTKAWVSIDTFGDLAALGIENGVTEVRGRFVYDTDSPPWNYSEQYGHAQYWSESYTVEIGDNFTWSATTGGNGIVVSNDRPSGSTTYDRFEIREGGDAVFNGKTVRMNASAWWKDGTCQSLSSLDLPSLEELVFFNVERTFFSIDGYHDGQRAWWITRSGPVEWSISAVPPAPILDQLQPSHVSGTDFVADYEGMDYRKGQSFTVGVTGQLMQVDFWAARVTSPATDFWFELRPAVDGVLVEDDSQILAKVNIPALDSNYAQLVSVDLSSFGLFFVEGDVVGFTLMGGTPGVKTRVFLDSTDPSPYPGGHCWYTQWWDGHLGIWTNTKDLAFATWVLPDVVDSDGDGVDDDEDAFPNDPNEWADSDGDGVGDNADICPGFNDFTDSDGDGVPDGCDVCPFDPENDADGDGVCGDLDVCEGGDDNQNADGDSLPDFCDVCPFDAANDADADGLCESEDNCPLVANASQMDSDADELGDACDPDDDNDGALDADDNCPYDWNPDQADFDGDGAGDTCDLDDDGDGVIDADDQCLASAVGAAVDANGCTIAQLCPCDNNWKNHGAFVKCNAHATEDFVEWGLMTEEEKDAIMSAAGGSSCGKKKK